jgi:hypothetical protein
MFLFCVDHLICNGGVNSNTLYLFHTKWFMLMKVDSVLVIQHGLLKPRRERGSNLNLARGSNLNLEHMLPQGETLDI